jgi:hypothetical protein
LLSDQPPKNRLIEGTLKLHSANVSFGPANGPLECFERVELDPHTLANGRHFDELDFASRWREIEGPNTEGLHARTSDTNLGYKRNSVRTSRHRRTTRLDTHVLRSIKTIPARN